MRKPPVPVAFSVNPVFCIHHSLNEMRTRVHWGCGWTEMLWGSCHFLCRYRKGICSQSKKVAGSDQGLAHAGCSWESSFLLWLRQDGDLSLVLNYKYMRFGSTIAPKTHTRYIRAEEAARAKIWGGWADTRSKVWDWTQARNQEMNDSYIHHPRTQAAWTQWPQEPPSCCELKRKKELCISSLSVPDVFLLPSANAWFVVLNLTSLRVPSRTESHLQTWDCVKKLSLLPLDPF